ncbi:MAG: hypothetical protein AAFQ22_12425 [Pseudomonadota bacterium]
MDLIERFDAADEKEWVMVDVALPREASRHFIKGELGFMAEDLVTQIGYRESETGLRLGFRDEAVRDQILEFLDPVIREAIKLTERRASTLRWARSMNRAGVSLESNGAIEEHRYVTTVTPNAD